MSSLFAQFSDNRKEEIVCFKIYINFYLLNQLLVLRNYMHVLFRLQEEEIEAISSTERDPAAHESEPTDLSVGISINNLTKIYNRVVR